MPSMQDILQQALYHDVVIGAITVILIALFARRYLGARRLGPNGRQLNEQAKSHP